MPENENASRVYAAFLLRGTDLDPDQVTSCLKIIPSRSFRRGDRHGKDQIWSHGYWETSSQNQVLSTDLELHIEWLLDQIEPVHPQLLILMANESIHAEISCFWESRTGHGGPSFSPKLMGRIAALDLELGIDIYFAS